MWQDYAYTVATILFSYGLFPQIKKNYDLKDASFISWQLCITCVFGIIISCVASISLKLYLTSILNIVQLICWLIIIAQKIKYGNTKNETPVRT